MIVYPENLGNLGNGVRGFVITTPSVNYSNNGAIGIGDINKDGFGDFIVSSPSDNTVYVLYGKGSFTNFSLASIAAGDGFRIIGDSGSGVPNLLGQSAAPLGDVNGDGFVDFAITATGNDNAGGVDAGAAYVIFGQSAKYTNASALSNSVKIIGTSTNYIANVSAAGDFNHDGIADLMVSGGTANNGTTWIFYGRTGNWGGTLNIAQANVTIIGAPSDFAYNPAAIGDFNGDGIDDIAIGAPSQQTGSVAHNGAVYVVYGSNAPAASINLASLGSGGLKIVGAAANDMIGVSVAGIGDFDKDGKADIAFSRQSIQLDDAGSAYVVYGTATSGTLNLSTLANSAGFRIDGAPQDNAGNRVSKAGDFNGDGFADVLISADYSNQSSPGAYDNKGGAYVIFGNNAHGGAVTVNASMNNTTNPRGVAIIGAGTADASGQYVTYAGDVNGDGGGDLIISGGNVTRQYIVYGEPVAVNTAPSGTDVTKTLLEDGSYTIATADFGFGDTNGNTLLAVKITTLPAFGTLKLNGTNVVAGQLVAATAITANQLVYTPVANANGTGYTSFTFQVQDNGGTANGGVDTDQSPNSFTFNVTAVNDAPVGTNKTVTTLEDTAYTYGTADFGFSDPNDSPPNTLLAVQIVTTPGAGALTLNGVAVTANQLVSVANITAGNLKFTPAANANGTGYASFTFKVQDNGGTANGGVDTDTTARTMTINVTGVNDAPAGADATKTINEDASYTFASSDFGFSDTSDSPPNTLLAVKIATLPTNGTLTLGGAAVTAGQFISAASLNTLVFTPAANANGTGYASFTFQVQDNGGTANGGVDLDPTPNTITFNVSSVNDAPAGADATKTINEDSSYTFGSSDFGFSDTNDNPANTLLAVKITTLPTNGSLTLNGVAVTAGQLIQVANLGTLMFTPAVNANGTGYASFTFQVQDNGGTANGGVDLDQTPNTITFNVNSVNDAPAGANATKTINEDASYTFASSDFGFSDSNDSPPNALLAVKITTLPANGTLTLGGAAVTAGQFIPVASIGTLVFTPAANANGASYASFTFQVQDGGGTANGGVDLDQTPNTITFNVTAVNDAPAGADATKTINEDASYTFASSDFGFSDTNDNPANTLLAVKITTLPTNGTLALGAGLVTVGQVIPAGSLGQLVFTPAANANGTGYASFTFQVQDNGGTANGGIDLDQTPNTITFNVTAVNDAPTATNLSVAQSYTEDTVLDLTDIVVSDIDSATVTATLTLSNVNAGALSTATSGGVTSTFVNGVWSASGAIASVNALLAGVTFTPAANFNASFTIATSVSDGSLSVSGSKAMTGIAVDDAPVAVNDAASVDENALATIAVLSNDTDIDGGPKTVATVNGVVLAAGGTTTLASGAIVTLNNDGSLGYDPNHRFDYLVSAGTAATNGSASSATDSFSYTINGGSAATVTVTINGVDGSGDQLTGTTGDNTVSGNPAFEYFYLQQGGHDTVVGGGGSDGFYFGAALDTLDRVIGAPGGDDQVIIQGNYTGGNAISLTGPVFTDIDTLAIQPGNDARFGDTSGALYSYNITVSDDIVAAGATLVVNANRLRVGENLTFDGSAETNGSFKFYAASGNDTLIGGAGNDQFYGRLGADTMTGGGGNDTFFYRAATESTTTSLDHITDFSAGDLIDLSFFDANTSNLPGTNDAFSFIGSAAFSAAGQLRVTDSGGGNWIVEGDIDGNGVADLTIAVTTTGGHALVATDFVL